MLSSSSPGIPRTPAGATESRRPAPALDRRFARLGDEELADDSHFSRMHSSRR